MDRIDGANTVDIGDGRRGFRKQNAAAGVSGTELTPDWFNGIQEELLAVIEGAGLAADPASWTQLREAITAMIAGSAADLSGYLEKAGGTMTGALTLAGAPTVDLHAATKAYVDGLVAAAAGLPGARRGILDVTSDTVVSYTADAVVAENGAGKTVKHRAVALTASTGVTGSGGLTGGALSASSWRYVWLQSDGTTASLIIDTSPTAPTLTGSNTYAVMIDAVRIDASSKLWRTKSVGGRTTIRVGTNPAVGVMMATGPAGTSASNLAEVSLANFAPPIAKSFVVHVADYLTGSGGTYVVVAPNNHFGGYGGTNSAPFSFNCSYQDMNDLLELDLETSSIWWYAGDANGGLLAWGWRI